MIGFYPYSYYIAIATRRRGWVQSHNYTYMAQRLERRNKVSSSSNMFDSKGHKSIFPPLIFLIAFKKIAQIIEVNGRIFSLQENAEHLI